MANIYKLACRETLSKFYRVTYSFPTVGNTFFSYRCNVTSEYSNGPFTSVHII